MVSEVVSCNSDLEIVLNPGYDAPAVGSRLVQENKSSRCLPMEPGAGWIYSGVEKCWLFRGLNTDLPELKEITRPLRLATLNILHDNSLNDVLQHHIRYESILRELHNLDADVIGLNEVTRSFLERLLRQEWVRSEYVVSVVLDDARCRRISTVLGDGTFGNVLLSRIPPDVVEYVEQPGDSRQSHVMSLRLHSPRNASGLPTRLRVCSTHLTACPWLMEGRRKQQLENLTSSLTMDTTGSPTATDDRFDMCIVMGDLNFHREAENRSIPSEWGELPAVVELGATWDITRNTMLPHYLPLRNIYNGFGLGAQFGWPNPMRLDRVLVHESPSSSPSSFLDRSAVTARIFADQSIHDRAKARGALPMVGPELQEAHRTLPWQEYLSPSDHFGIFFELPLFRSHSHNSSGDGASATQPRHE